MVQSEKIVLSLVQIDTMVKKGGSKCNLLLILLAETTVHCGELKFVMRGFIHFFFCLCGAHGHMKKSGCISNALMSERGMGKMDISRSIATLVGGVAAGALKLGVKWQIRTDLWGPGGKLSKLFGKMAFRNATSK